MKMEEMKAGAKQAVRLATNREKKLAVLYADYTKAVEEAEKERAESA